MEFAHCNVRGRIPIQRDLLRHAALLDRLLQEPLRRGDIAPSTQEKIDGLLTLINPSIQISPGAFNLAIRFVDTTRTPYGARIPLPALRKLRDIALHPT